METITIKSEKEFDEKFEWIKNVGIDTIENYQETKEYYKNKHIKTMKQQKQEDRNTMKAYEEYQKQEEKIITSIISLLKGLTLSRAKGLLGKTNTRIERDYIIQ